jgi:hypothetical protein
VITELADVAEAVISLDQSYTIHSPWEVMTPDCLLDGATDSEYTDEAYISETFSEQGPNDQGVVQPCGTDIDNA